MDDRVNRRRVLRIAGTSLGFGALYRVAPLSGEAGGTAARIQKLLGRKNGEPMTPFSFVQLSDTHVGFQGPPNPLGTKAFERAVELINGLSEKPDLVLVTGDLTHDSEKPGESPRPSIFPPGPPRRASAPARRACGEGSRRSSRSSRPLPSSGRFSCARDSWARRSRATRGPSRC